MAKSSWGKVTPSAESDHNQTGNWTLLYDQLSWCKPELYLIKEKDRVDAEGNPVELVSYMDFLEGAYPKDGPNGE